jgi:uncharacterized protein (TIGR03083 family)
MDKAQIWSTIHAERKALAADLEGLTYEQWATPSLCEGWTVRDVLAHMTAAAEQTPLSFFTKFARAGFNFPRFANKDVARVKSNGDVLASFKAAMGNTTAPPGPTMTWLGETIVHGDDIRRAVGIKYDYPPEATTAVADSYKTSNLLIGSKKRIAGLKLSATDTDWTHGEGAEVSGKMIDLLMAMAGRAAAVGALTGDGVATLKSRM